MLAKGGAIAWLVIVVLALAGCGLERHRSVGIEAWDVESVDLYFYTWGLQEPSGRHTHITDRSLIRELVGAFTDMPVQNLKEVPATADGAKATKVVYTLRDGATVELTQISLFPEDTIIKWDDGTVQHSRWGVALVDYYKDLGDIVRESPHAA